MTKKTQVILNFVMPIIAIVWIASWYFESVPFTYAHDYLLKKWGLHFPLVLAFVPSLLLLIWVAYARIQRAKVREMALSYEQLVIRLQFKLLFKACAMLILAGAAYFSLTLASKVPVAEATAIELDASKAPPFWIWMKRVNINGQPGLDAITVARNRDHASWTQLERFVPLLATKKGADSSRVYFSETYSSAQTVSPKRKRVATNGYVSLQLLPASARNSFKQNGLKVPVLSYVIVQDFIDLKPYLRALSVLFGMLSVLLLVILMMSKKIHTKKLQDSWDHQRGYNRKKRVEDDVFPW